MEEEEDEGRKGVNDDVDDGAERGDVAVAPEEVEDELIGSISITKAPDTSLRCVTREGLYIQSPGLPLPLLAPVLLLFVVTLLLLCAVGLAAVFLGVTVLEVLVLVVLVTLAC